jgi:hypothetical protein
MWSSSSVTKDSVRQGASVRSGRVRCAARLPGHRCGSGVSGVFGVVQQRRRGADVARTQAGDREVGADDAALYLVPRCLQGCEASLELVMGPLGSADVQLADALKTRTRARVLCGVPKLDSRL